MKVLELSSQRFDVALDLLQEGSSPLEFSGVNFSLDRENQILRVYVLTQWLVENLNEHRAIAEIEKGKDAYDYLIRNSDHFGRIVKGFQPQFSLVNDYGSGSMEICYLSADKLVWK